MVEWHGTLFHRETTVWALLSTYWRCARPYALHGRGAGEAGDAAATALAGVAVACGGQSTGAGARHPRVLLPCSPPPTSPCPLSPMRPLPERRPLPETYRSSTRAGPEGGQIAGRPGETLPKFFLALGESIFLLAGDLVVFRVDTYYWRSSLECFGSCLMLRGTS